MNRRVLVAGIALLAVITMLAGLPGGLPAQGKVAKIGLSLPLTGAEGDCRHEYTSSHGVSSRAMV